MQWMSLFACFYKGTYGRYWAGSRWCGGGEEEQEAAAAVSSFLTYFDPYQDSGWIV